MLATTRAVFNISLATAHFSTKSDKRFGTLAANVADEASAFGKR
jgi:hypothetical protein